jgi:sulfhydrogenase subunit beta (sulfur reductase)
MSYGFLSKGALRRWLGALLNDQPLIAPVRQGRRFVFSAVDDVNDIAFDAGRTSRSPREFLTSTVDPIFTTPARGSRAWTGSGAPAEHRVLYGIRPCDARALASLHLGQDTDPAELLATARRDRVTLVGVACGDGPWAGCFCTSVGGDPADRSHVDVLLVPAPGGFAVDPVTTAGLELLASAAVEPLDAQLLPPAGPARASTLSDAAGRLRPDHPIWAEMADRCLDCGTCADECPLGLDGAPPGEGTRPARRQDGPSPQEPRGTQTGGARHFYYVAGQGRILCVGCGRCAVDCRAGNGVRDVLTQVSGHDRPQGDDH